MVRPHGFNNKPVATLNPAPFGTPSLSKRSSPRSGGDASEPVGIRTATVFSQLGTSIGSQRGASIKKTPPGPDVKNPKSGVQQPGTGTPGYWKNHPAAWPVQSIMVGGRTYTKAEAIGWLGKVGKDKSTTMFSSLVPAMLNILLGNDGSCVNGAIAAADKWMVAHPVGSNVAGSSDAWRVGEPLHVTMDSYNNGLLCAPHRQ
jgi:hypothetical protein